MTGDELQKIYDGFAENYKDNREQFNIDDILTGYYSRLSVRPGGLLDLGCGAGIPVAEYFADRDWSVTGVDFSQKMLTLAKQHVPSLTAVHADMRQAAFEDSAFDAVTAVYSLFHVPRDEHGAMFEKIYRWLKPGGAALMTYATKAYTGADEFDGYKEFMGQFLYYSHYSTDRVMAQLRQTGFDSVENDYVDIGGETFLWLIAVKPT